MHARLLSAFWENTALARLRHNMLEATDTHVQEVI